MVNFTWKKLDIRCSFLSVMHLSIIPITWLFQQNVTYTSADHSYLWYMNLLIIPTCKICFCWSPAWLTGSCWPRAAPYDEAFYLPPLSLLYARDHLANCGLSGKLHNTADRYNRSVTTSVIFTYKAHCIFRIYSFFSSSSGNYSTRSLTYLLTAFTLSHPYRKVIIDCQPFQA
jgi:hypothetical protein